MKLLYEFLGKDGKKYEIYEVFPEDWEKVKDEVVEIEESAFPEGVRDEESELRESFTSGNFIPLVVKQEDKIVAYTVGGSGNCYSYVPEEDQRGDVFYIDSTAVHRSYQGNGIGTVLKLALIKIVREKGYRKIAAHCISEKIVGINEKYGFEKKKYYEDWLGVGAWYMVLDFEEALEKLEEMEKKVKKKYKLKRVS